MIVFSSLLLTLNLSFFLKTSVKLVDGTGSLNDYLAVDFSVMSVLCGILKNQQF